MFLVVQIATACRFVPRRAQLQKAALGHEIGRTGLGLEDRTLAVGSKLRVDAGYRCARHRAASNTRETTDE
jgi:hypothetical protein